MPAPSNSTKVAYGNLTVSLQGPLHRCAPVISRDFPMHVGLYPLRSEVLGTVSNSEWSILKRLYVPVHAVG